MDLISTIYGKAAAIFREIVHYFAKNSQEKDVYSIVRELIKSEKWTYVKAVNFFRDVVPYFLERKSLIKSDEIVAVSLRIGPLGNDNSLWVDKGILNFGANGFIVCGLFNTKLGEFIDNMDLLVIEYTELDDDTLQKFGENDLLIIT